MADYRLLPAGDTALVVEFGDRIDRELSALVLALARRLDRGADRRHRRMRADVPLADGATTIRCCCRMRRSAAHIAKLMQGLRASRDRGPVAGGCRSATTQASRPISPMSRRAPNLTPAQVIERHSAADLSRLHARLPARASPIWATSPAELALPRRQSPRMKIPAGSLAIAMTMTCIFPLETPCGWHLIGRSPGAAVGPRARRGDAAAAAGRQGRLRAGVAARIRGPAGARRPTAG